jgi:hypothetical protein
MTKLKPRVEIDVSQYVRAPNLNVSGTIALGASLITALPAKANKAVRTSAQVMRERLVELKDAWKSRGHAAGVDSRPVDLSVDNAWRALFARLSAWEHMPVTRVSKAVRAQELLGRLFPDGTSFTQLPFQQQWAESDKKLTLMAEEKLEADLVALVGREFVDEVRSTHAVYGEVLGITKSKGPPLSEADLVEPLRAALNAISEYALQVVAQAKGTDSDELDAFLAALAPIDAARPVMQGSKPKAPPPLPSEAVPELPVTQ